MTLISPLQLSESGTTRSARARRGPTASEAERFASKLSSEGEEMGWETKTTGR